MAIRLYFDGPLKLGSSVKLDSSELHYFKSVHRSSGDIQVFNRMGEWASGKFDGKVFVVESVVQAEPKEFPISLGLALPDAKVLAEVIPMASELGLQKIYLFPGERSQSGSKRVSEKKERWEKIAIESARQCLRSKPIEIESVSLQNLLDSKSFSQKVCFSEYSSDPDSLTMNLAKNDDTKDILILIGPEGGWSAKEDERFRKAGFLFCHLDAPVLRVATAVAMASAVVMTSLFTDRVQWSREARLRVDR